MTLPRRIVPGAFYLITRCCTQREFLLRPSATTNRIVSFCLALAARATGVQLHVVCVMSNHWHAVLSDPMARLPEFMERAHRLIAKALNAVLHRRENFWSSEKASVVELASDQAVLDKMAYVIANPVRAGLVDAPDKWPGVITLGLAQKSRIERPHEFFDPHGDLPHAADLEFKRPAIFGSLSNVELGEHLNDAVLEIVRKTRQRFREEGRSFAGAKAVEQQSPHTKPSTPRTPRTLSPRVAAPESTLRARAIKAIKDFVRAYRDAWLSWRSGERNQWFPCGTYALRRYAAVRCKPFPAVA